jgi:hypothetical protein
MLTPISISGYRPFGEINSYAVPLPLHSLMKSIYLCKFMFICVIIQQVGVAAAQMMW